VAVSHSALCLAVTRSAPTRNVRSVDPVPRHGEDGLQWIVAFLTVRSKTFEHVIKSQPTLLFANGAFLEPELRNQRVAHDEVLSAVRKRGF
jgi:hypothetical protein